MDKRLKVVAPSAFGSDLLGRLAQVVTVLPAPGAADADVVPLLASHCTTW